MERILVKKYDKLKFAKLYEMLESFGQNDEYYKMTHPIDYDIQNIIDFDSDVFINIDNVPTEALKRQFYRLVHRIPSHKILPHIGVRKRGSVFEQYIVENESFGTISPTKVLDNIKAMFDLENWQVGVKTACNNIEVIFLIANMEDNEETIRTAMSNEGYYLSRKFYVTKENIPYIRFVFHPKQQTDVTCLLKNNKENLYHWSPMENVSSILQNGLIPKHNSEFEEYPSRIYVFEPVSKEMLKNGLTETPPVDKSPTGLLLSMSQRTGKTLFGLFEINKESLPDTVRFYYDPNWDKGFYTINAIPARCLSIKNKNINTNDLRFYTLSDFE